MDTTELRRLAANTPVHDQRRYALRWAAEEIDKLNARLEFAKNELTKGKKNKHLILQNAGGTPKTKPRVKILSMKRHEARP